MKEVLFVFSCCEKYIYQMYFSLIFDEHLNLACYHVCWHQSCVSVCVSVSYPGCRRRSRAAPACCSTWPRTHRSWSGSRPPSPRPASLRRRPAWASCSVCRRNESQRLDVGIISLVISIYKDKCLLCQPYITDLPASWVSSVLWNVNISQDLADWQKFTWFPSSNTRLYSKIFLPMGPVRQRPRPTGASVTLATAPGRMDSDWLKPMSHL